MGANWPHLNGSIHSRSSLGAICSPPLNCWSPSSSLQGTHSRLHGAPIHHSILNIFLTTHSKSTLLSHSISTSWWFNYWIHRGITPGFWCMMWVIDWWSIWAWPELQSDWPPRVNHTHSWQMGWPLAPWLVLVFTKNGLVAFTFGLVTTWLWTLLATTGHTADMTILMVTVFCGPKELAGVSGRVWLESAIWLTWFSSFAHIPLQSWEAMTWGISITTAWGRMKFYRW